MRLIPKKQLRFGQFATGLKIAALPAMEKGSVQQELKYLIILDFGTRREREYCCGSPFFYFVTCLEATCTDKGKLQPQEVIEFPSVLLNVDTLEVQHRLHLFEFFFAFCAPPPNLF